MIIMFSHSLKSFIIQYTSVLVASVFLTSGQASSVYSVVLEVEERRRRAVHPKQASMDARARLTCFVSRGQDGQEGQSEDDGSHPACPLSLCSG